MSAGLDQSEIGFNGASDFIQYSFGAAYTTQPTISYSPLQGENFVKSIMSPIPLEALFTLAGSGWNGQRVFGICVERINGIENQPSASGPTPAVAFDDYRPFERLMNLLGQVRHDRLLVPQVDPQTEQPLRLIRSSAAHREEIRELKELLGLDRSLDVYKVDSDFLHARPDTISIRTRSLMNIFFYQSQRVDAPKVHQDEGLVTVARREDGSPFDWGSTPAGRIFHIYVSKDPPKKAFLAIAYRDHWSYLADNDLESKTTFMLLMQLFKVGSRRGPRHDADPDDPGALSRGGRRLLHS